MHTGVLLRGGLAAAIGLGASGCGGDGGAEPGGPPIVLPGGKPLEKPPENTVGGFQIEIPPVTVEPGGEVEPCFVLPLEIEGPSRIMGGAVMRAASGMHHGNILARKRTGEAGPRACTPEEETIENAALELIEGAVFIFASSTQIKGDEWQRFPDGMGLPIGEDYEIIARMHYLNPTGEPSTPHVVYEWFTIDEATVVERLNAFGWVFKGFEIPANSEHTVTGACDLPDLMNIVTVMPHMHRLGTRFTGGYGSGELFLDSPGYDPDDGVVVQYDPAIPIAPAQGIRFSCTWKNTHDKVIVEGIGDNEMCMAFGYSYPETAAFTVFATSEENCVYVPTPVAE